MISKWHTYFLNYNKEVSVKVFDWHIWWNMWTDFNGSSSKTPRYRYGNIDIPKFFFGKDHRLQYPIREFTDIYFMFRGKEYKLDKVEWIDRYMIRSRIPMGIWHQKWLSCGIEIKNPPK